MEILGQILELLDAKMPVPQMYGGFHLFFFIASVLAGFGLCRWRPAPDETCVRRVLLWCSVLVVALEVYKQVNYSFHYDGTAITFDYQWYAFPFQFCSTPMYVGLVGSLTKSRKLHGAACAYLATYSVFAGLCVMVYPAQVFVGTIGINIQTMVCHGAMIAVGIFLLHTGYVKPEHSTIKKAIPVFLTMAALAVGMNEVAYRVGLLETETFNMFQFSPYCAPSLPVYSLVQQALPAWLSIAVYVAGFTLAAHLILALSMAVERAASRLQKPRTQTGTAG